MSENSIEDFREKAAEILETAQRLFGMFGYEKTTVSDIAFELHMTKGSLYYYYPNKESIYIAVVQKEHDQIIELVNEKIAILEDPAQMIYEYVNIRILYFKTFLNLSRFTLNDFRFGDVRKIHDLIHEKWKLFKVQENDLIVRILKLGIEKDVFNVEDVNQVSELLLDIIKGLCISTIKHKNAFYLDDVEYEKLHKKIDLFVNLFVKALKK